MKKQIQNKTSVKKNKSNKNVQNNAAEDMSLLRVRINPSRSLLPISMRCTHQYYQQINFSAVTTPQVYIFRGNGAYDPDQTGTGSQPVGWDNMLDFYGGNFCVGSVIKFNIVNLGVATAQFSITPTRDSTTLSSYNDALIMPGTKIAIADGTSKGGKSFTSLSHSASTLSFLHSTYDRDFIATGQAVPGKQWYWSLTAQSFDQATALSFSIQATILYDIVWIDRKLVPLS